MCTLQLKNCFNAGFCELEKDEELKILNTLERISNDKTEVYKGWIAIEIKISEATKLIQTEVCQKFCEEIQNNDYDQEDNESKFVENHAKIQK